MNLMLPNPEYPIIVHSHLGWDWVWQRPQQFLSRLSARHPVLFVEGPVPDPAIDKARLEIRQIAEFPAITVLRMAMPVWSWSWARTSRKGVSLKLTERGVSRALRTFSATTPPSCLPRRCRRSGRVPRSPSGR